VKDIQVTQQRSSSFLWIRDFGMLIKFRLSLTVVMSSALAFVIATEGPVDYIKLLVLSIGGFLVTGAAGILNQVLEKDYDRLMKRTENRPLPKGRMGSSTAVLLAGLLCLMGVVLLSFLNPLSGFLSIISFILYAFVYTPMKRVSHWSVAVGAIPGALPTLIGAVATSGGLTWLGLSLFSIQFFWQFPHFRAITFLAKDDYQKAGFEVFPPGKNLDKALGLDSIVNALILIPFGILPYFLGVGTIFSVIGITIASLFYAYLSYSFYKEPIRKTALALMFSSFFYLPFVLILLCLK
jgi:heme o synthase